MLLHIMQKKRSRYLIATEKTQINSAKHKHRFLQSSKYSLKTVVVVV